MFFLRVPIWPHCGPIRVSHVRVRKLGIIQIIAHDLSKVSLRTSPMWIWVLRNVQVITQLMTPVPVLVLNGTARKETASLLLNVSISLIWTHTHRLEYMHTPTI